MKLNNVLFLLILLWVGCDSGPKVIESEAVKAAISESSLPIFKDVPTLAPPTNTNEQHKVVVEEVLNTEKYSYLNVSENEEKFWVAISKREVAVGDTYYYKGGLMKQNFFSKEFNRVFETVYLVSNIWKKPKGGMEGSALEQATANISAPESLPDIKVGEIEHAEGAMKLADLFSKKELHDGQPVKITGKVVKVNPMIMNRNWLHIQDGSGEGLDLTVTTTENIPLGHVVTLEGTIELDKDFGAGYRYDIIMEGAVLR